ncbi:MAG: Prolyl oligopeptidase family protein [Verrucomicrobiales bacterium]|nr:Prolyl oligopeptidase family protein [Verrucomicrobiales bacterium]MDB6130926.1 Prolyl oligopeptidase family protein [Verrucomicrobiales bacterium]
MIKNLLLVLSLASLVSTSVFAAEHQKYTRTQDVVYGRKFGTALTMDVFKPENPNKCAIVFVVSGGWFSSHDGISIPYIEHYLDRGYTVFAVVHGSQPRFIIPEIEEDLHRSVRFIRHNAEKFGINGEKLGITGASAGGHLSLTIGTQGKPGKPESKDPIDRESSAVQAVACFFPPTDFLNWSEAGEDAVGIQKLAAYKPAFGPRSDNLEERAKMGKEISPIYFVHSNMPPILIIHGTADRIVPIHQAEIFVKKCEEFHDEIKLMVKEGKDHGWQGMEPDFEACADWFDAHLLPKK